MSVKLRVENQGTECDQRSMVIICIVLLNE